MEKLGMKYNRDSEYTKMEAYTDRYDNFIFDLYGTLIDVRTDEHAPQTWKKWFRWLDAHGFPHPDYIRFRKEFFDMDRGHREIALAAGPFEVPEIDVIPIYEELFERYAKEGLYSKSSLAEGRTNAGGRGKRGGRKKQGSRPKRTATVEEASYAFRVASRSRIGLYPGVTEYLDRLRSLGKHVYILSNAQASYTFPEIRMFGLDKMTDDLLMSSDEGVMKPDRAFYDMLIEKHGMDRSRTVMIGDSAWSDIAGAKKAGIDSIWLNGENRASVFYLKQTGLLKVFRRAGAEDFRSTLWREFSEF